MPASFAGRQFHVETGGKTSGRRIALHEYPKRDTPYTEDMGRRVYRFTLTGYLITSPSQPDYRPARDALLAACDNPGRGVLQHPTLGTLNVICEMYYVQEMRQRGGYCQVDFTFIEIGSPGNSVATQNTATQSQNAADSLGGAASNSAANSIQNESVPIPTPRPSPGTLGPTGIGP